MKMALQDMLVIRVMAVTLVQLLESDIIVKYVLILTYVNLVIMNVHFLPVIQLIQ